MKTLGQSKEIDPNHAIIILCPSLGHNCGISSYSEFAQEALKNSGFCAKVVNTPSQAIAASSSSCTYLIVQHEYGIYDGNSSAFPTPTISEIISLDNELRQKCSEYYSSIIMHTYHHADTLLAAYNMQLLSSGIPIFHLNETGASLFGLHYLEHGVFLLGGEETPGQIRSAKETFTIGTFGLLSPNKNVTGLIDCAAKANARIVANLATNDKKLAAPLQRYSINKGVDFTLTTDFASEAELLQLLSKADACIAFQDDIPHYSTSGSARFLLNLGVPVITSNCRQFEDIASGVIRTSTKNAPKLLRQLHENPSLYSAACLRARTFAKHNSMDIVYADLISRMHSIGNRVRSPGHVFLGRGASNWRPTQSLLAPSDIQAICNCDENIESSNVLQRLIDLIDSRLALLPAPWRLFASSNFDSIKSITSPLGKSILRWLMPLDNAYSIIDGLPKGQQEDHLLFWKSIRHQSSLNPKSIIAAADRVLGSTSQSNALPLRAQIEDHIHCKLFTSYQHEAYYPHALATCMLLDAQFIPAFLSISLPSQQEALYKYIDEHDRPPLRLSKREAWLQDFHSTILSIATRNSNAYASSSSVGGSYVRRQIFFVEEFLWLSIDDFANFIQLALLKESPTKTTTNHIKDLLLRANDSASSRIEIIISYYNSGKWSRGYPLILFSSLQHKESAQPSLRKMCNKARAYMQNSYQSIGTGLAFPSDQIINQDISDDAEYAIMRSVLEGLLDQRNNQPAISWEVSQLHSTLSAINPVIPSLLLFA